MMRHLPHVSSHLQETLDQLLTTAAFDQTVGALFVDDGVLQLKAEQNPGVHGLKDTAAIFKALQIYDVEQLFVEKESLDTRGLAEADLLLPVQLIHRAQVNDLIKGYDVVIPD